MIAIPVLFVLITVVRLPVLRMPPYWDHAIGLWTEANFLAETDFDYHRLWTEEKPIWEGGARCYLTSVLPTGVALLMKMLPTAEATFVVYHLLTFLATAVCLWLVYRLVADRVGMAGGLLTAAAVGTNPLFSVQVDMLGMEIPLALWTLLAIWLAQREWFVAASVCGLMAFLMKASGVVVSGAVLGYTIIALFGYRKEAAGRSLPKLVVVALFQALILVAEAAAMMAAGHVASQFEASHRTSAPGLGMMVFWSPDVLLVLLLCAGFLIAIGLRYWRSALAGDGRGGALVARIWHAKLSASRELAGRADQVVAVLVVIGTLLAIWRVILLPRYLVVAIPPLFMLAGILLFERRAMRPLAVVVAGLWIATNVLNWNGRLLPDQAWVIETAFGVQDGEKFVRTGAFLERSHEYLPDHVANQRLLRALEEQVDDSPVIAGTPFVHFLAFPRLGYVTQPLRGWAANPFTDLVDTFPPATPEILAALPERPIFISASNTFYRLSNRFEIPAPSAQDMLIEGSPDATTLTVFLETSLSGETVDREQLAVWYAARMWPHEEPHVRGLLQARALANHGFCDAALRCLLAAVDARPSEMALRVEVARHRMLRLDRFRAIADGMAVLDDPAEGVVSPDTLVAEKLGGQEVLEFLPDCTWQIEQPQEPKSARVREGLEDLLAGNLNDAAEEFVAAAEEDPGSALASFAAGSVWLARGQLDRALPAFETAASFEATSPVCHESLGRVLFALGELGRAEQALRSAIDQGSDLSANAEYLLGLVLARQGKTDEAAQWFHGALEIRPDFADAAEKLRQLESGRE